MRKLAGLEEKVIAPAAYDAELERRLNGLIELASKCHQLSARAIDSMRRRPNQAFFEGILVDTDDEPDGEPIDVFEIIFAATDAVRAQVQKTTDAIMASVAHCLSQINMVPLEGLEPPTLSLGRNCSSIELQRLMPVQCTAVCRSHAPAAADPAGGRGGATALAVPRIGGDADLPRVGLGGRPRARTRRWRTVGVTASSRMAATKATMTIMQLGIRSPRLVVREATRRTALERGGQALCRASRVLFTVAAADATPETAALEADPAPPAPPVHAESPASVGAARPAAGEVGDSARTDNRSAGRRV